MLKGDCLSLRAFAVTDEARIELSITLRNHGDLHGLVASFFLHGQENNPESSLQTPQEA